MTHEILKKVEEDIKNTHLTEQENERVNLVLTIEADIQTLEKILQKKRSDYNEKCYDLNALETFILHSRLLKNRIIKEAEIPY